MNWASSSMFPLLPPSWINWPSRIITRHIIIGFLLGLSFSWSFTGLASRLRQQKKERKSLGSTSRGIRGEVVHGVTGLIGMRPTESFARQGLHIVGNTPLVRINSLSDALGVEILGKAEVS